MIQDLIQGAITDLCSDDADADANAPPNAKTVATFAKNLGSDLKSGLCDIINDILSIVKTDAPFCLPEKACNGTSLLDRTKGVNGTYSSLRWASNGKVRHGCNRHWLLAHVTGSGEYSQFRHCAGHLRWRKCQINFEFDMKKDKLEQTSAGTTEFQIYLKLEPRFSKSPSGFLAIMNKLFGMGNKGGSMSFTMWAGVSKEGVTFGCSIDIPG